MITLAIILYLLGCFLANYVLTKQILYFNTDIHRGIIIFFGTMLSWVTIAIFMIDFYINTHNDN